MGIDGKMKPFVKYVLLKNRWKILGAGGVLGAYTLIRLLPAAVLERFINSMQGVSDAKFHLVLLAVLYLLSALSLYAAEIGKNYFSRKLAWNMTDELRVRLLARNLRMGQSFYNRYGTGEIIEHLDGDINVLESFISATMVPVLIDVLSLLFVIAIFFYTSTVLGICFIVFCAVVFTLLYLMQKTDSDSVAEERSAMTDLTSFWAEVVRLRKEIRLMHKKPNIFRRINEMMAELKQRQIRKQKYLYRIWITSLFTFALGNVLSLLIGGVLYLSGSITLGTVYLIYAYSNLLRAPMEQMQHHLQNYTAAKSSFARLCEMYSYDDRIVEGEMSPEGVEESIRVENVSHRFEDTVALDRVSFEIFKNETLGIFGESGSGKSTISKIICKLYPLQEGKITLFGKDIDSICTQDLRRCIAYVTASEQVFSATLKENLDMQSLYTSEEVEAIIHKYGLGRFLESFEGKNLKERLQSVLSPDTLSVGERQMLNMLRLFFCEKKMIIFDEAAANVDRSIEEDFFKLFDLAAGRQMSMMITHNVERLAKCDKILALDRGRVVEYGDQRVLAKDRDSLYFQHSQSRWAR